MVNDFLGDASIKHWCTPDLSNRWILYFLKIARAIAEQSKDPSTKVGAVIVSSDKQIISTGYNGFPVNVDDTPERYKDRPTKLKMVVHAEANAICQAAKHGHHIDGCAIFCTLVPCIGCAKLIIQSGIKAVYFPAYQPKSTQINTVVFKLLDGAVRAFSESILDYLHKVNDAYMNECLANKFFSIEASTPDEHYASIYMPQEMLYRLANSTSNETCCEVARYVSNQLRKIDLRYKEKCCGLIPEITVEPLVVDVQVGCIVNGASETPCEEEWRDKIADSLNLLKEANIECFLIDEAGNVTAQ